eukprot:gene9839-biopygen19760
MIGAKKTPWNTLRRSGGVVGVTLGQRVLNGETAADARRRGVNCRSAQRSRGSARVRARVGAGVGRAHARACSSVDCPLMQAPDLRFPIL